VSLYDFPFQNEVPYFCKGAAVAEVQRATRSVIMPKLDKTHLTSRLLEQIERLRQGNTLVVRDVKVLLTPEQLNDVEQAWEAQKSLRTAKRPRSDAERLKLGIKDKRESYIEALESALEVAKAGNASALKEELKRATVRQTRVYFDALNKAEEQGKTGQSAKSFANNELTRAGLRRMDGSDRFYKSKRDAEVNEMERVLEERLNAQLTDEERFQQSFLKSETPSTKLVNVRKGVKRRKK